MARLASLITLPLITFAAALTGCTTDVKINVGDAGNNDSGPSATGGSGNGGDAGANGGSSGTGGGGGSGGGTAMHRDRSALSNVGTTKPLDYSDPALWLCLPGESPNECLDDIDATEIMKDNTTQVVKTPVATNPDYDCFYVFPTVDLTGDGNLTNFSNINLILDPLLAQAAPFRQLCKLYAPLYRQQAIATGMTTTGDGGGGMFTGDPAVADGDVAKAFQYYLDNYNKGRRFVLIGHSQGTMKLIKLIQDKIDADAAMRNLLISAVLLGAPSGVFYAPTGKDVGGTFKNVKLCTKPGQVGCAIGYSSFAKEAPPTATSVFGQAPAGNSAACTNPAVLAGNTGDFKGSFFPVKLNQVLFTSDTPANTPPTVATPFRLYRNMFKGACIDKGGFSYLEISTDVASDDKREIPPYRSATLEGVGFGMHVGDYAPELDDIIEAVKQQAAAPH